jgi:hypothetical protein
MSDSFDTRKELSAGGKRWRIWSLPALKPRFDVDRLGTVAAARGISMTYRF